MTGLGTIARLALFGAGALAISALVIVGLLNGACGSSSSSVPSPPPGRCTQRGVCFDHVDSVSRVRSCNPPWEFSEDECPADDRIGYCTSSTSDIHVYGYGVPLHGRPPDCRALMGDDGAVWRRM